MEATSTIQMLANTVRNRRKALRLTQAQLAALAGVSPRFVFSMEAGKESIALDKAIAVLSTLGLDIYLKDSVHV